MSKLEVLYYIIDIVKKMKNPIIKMQENVQNVHQIKASNLILISLASGTHCKMY